MRNEFTAIVERDGPWFVAYCAEVPGALRAMLADLSDHAGIGLRGEIVAVPSRAFRCGSARRM